MKKIKNQNLLEQFFLVDERVVERLIKTAEVESRDRILEIGPGTGVITRKLVEKAGKTIAVEIDKKFREDLKKIPGRLQLVFDNVLKLLEKRTVKFSKIVGSLPSSVVEPLLRHLIMIDFEVASVLLPLKFVDKLLKDIFWTTYFDTQLITKVDKKSFNPQPRTNWALVKITKKPPPLLVKDYQRFVRKYLIEHPKAKLKNALVEAIIQVALDKGRKLTKNQARKIVWGSGISS